MSNDRKRRTCFSLSALQKLARAWNERYKAPLITNIAHRSKMDLWKDIDERMNSQCKQKGNEGCWVDKLRMEEQSEPFQDLRPPTPISWYQDPHTWLNNFDIEDVMEQYERDPDNHYNFIGVFPMDFAQVYDELNSIKWSSLTKNGKFKYIGMITNLDDHDEPGSHWTSLFACLDSSLPSYGAYYYDSVSNPPTKEIHEFMFKLMVRSTIESLRTTTSTSDVKKLENFPFVKYNDREKQQFTALVKTIVKANGIPEPRPFRLAYNTHQHQYKNTECGVFSMVFQIRWVEGLRKNKLIKFEDVISHRMQDDEIHMFRKKLFRPNTKATVGGRRVKAVKKNKPSNLKSGP